MVPALIYGMLEVASLLALYWIPPGHPFLDATALAAFGLGMGGLLVYLGGLMAIDLVSRRAAGAAMGLVGLFSYLVAGVQDTLSGCLLDVSKVVVNGTTTLEGRTGRGDTCTASFLVARGRGMDLPDAAAFAAEVTLRKMQYRGSYRG